MNLITLSLSLVLAPGAMGKGLRVLQTGTPSAKFTAVWDTDPVVAANCINYNSGDLDDTIWAGSNFTDLVCAGSNPSERNEDLDLEGATSLGLLKLPEKKEILIGMSAEIAIFTINTATSKKRTTEYYGNIGATKAMGGIDVTLLAKSTAADGNDMECKPGKVTFASRYVELRNQIGGNATYEDCYRDSGTDALICDTKIADLELESSIGLGMKTVSANHFNFVCPDAEQGTYILVAKFELTTASGNLCNKLNSDCATINDLAGARVILGTRMLTAQTVRAQNNL